MNRKKTKKIKEIIRKGMKELGIKRINKIKELEEIETDLRTLEIKIMKERIKAELQEFEIKRLEIEAEIKTEILKENEKQ